jgi:putative transposase
VSRYEQLAKVKDYRRENPYAGQLHSHILQVVVADVDQAFQAFFRRVKAGVVCPWIEMSMQRVIS